MGGCKQVICKYAILYKGLKHPQILVSVEVLESMPDRY